MRGHPDAFHSSDYANYLKIDITLVYCGKLVIICLSCLLFSTTNDRQCVKSCFEIRKDCLLKCLHIKHTQAHLYMLHMPHIVATFATLLVLVLRWQQHNFHIASKHNLYLQFLSSSSLVFFSLLDAMIFFNTSPQPQIWLNSIVTH